MNPSASSMSRLSRRRRKGGDGADRHSRIWDSCSTITREQFGRWKQKFCADDEAVGPYVAEINDNFITCRYATFSSEGAMLGYLLHGEPERTFAAIATSLAQALIPHPHFPIAPKG